MGTRSNLVIMEDGRQLVRIYRQMDGYPSGMGNDIKAALNNGRVKLCNGFSSRDEIPAAFNGMGCLAAYIIGALKGNDIGNIYIDSRRKLKKSDFDIEYEYTLTDKGGVLHLIALERHSARDKVIFDGPLADFDGKAIEKAAEESEAVKS